MGTGNGGQWSSWIASRAGAPCPTMKITAAAIARAPLVLLPLIKIRLPPAAGENCPALLLQASYERGKLEAQALL